MKVSLLSKPGCHLCEDARAELDQLRSKYPHELEVVDITADAALLQRYWDQIPVVRVGAQELTAPLTRHALEQALRSAER